MPTGKNHKPPPVPALFGYFFWPIMSLWILFLILILYTGTVFFSQIPEATKFRWLTVAGIASIGGTILTGLIAYFMAQTFQRPFNEIIHFLDEIETNPALTVPTVEGPDAFHDLAFRIRRFHDRHRHQLGELRVEYGKLQAVLAGLGEGLIAVDAEERIVFANDRSVNLLQLREADHRGVRIWELVRNRTLLEAYKKSRRTGAPVRLELLWDGPPERHLLCHVSALGSGEQGSTVIGIHDVTELRRLETLRQEFVANVSHELKTPLAVIKVAVETLIDGAIDDLEGRGQFLRQIDEQSDRLQALIMDMLALARVESGAMTFDFEEINLIESVEDCLARLATRAQSRNQILEASTPPAQEPLHVWADEESIRQILDNLVDNAIKYTPRGGKVTVCLGTEGGKAVLQVKDNGIGIPAADLPRIFERFYRVDRARSREMGGTGLGLSIVKHLALAMNGSVEAKSEPDVGSVFTVRLPLALPHPGRLRHSA